MNEWISLIEALIILTSATLNYGLKRLNLPIKSQAFLTAISLAESVLQYFPGRAASRLFTV